MVVESCSTWSAAAEGYTKQGPKISFAMCWSACHSCTGWVFATGGWGKPKEAGRGGARGDATESSNGKEKIESRTCIYLSSVATRIELGTTCRDGRVCDSLSEALWCYMAWQLTVFPPSTSPPSIESPLLQTRHPFRDMSLENILLDYNGRAKIIDFGMAREGHPHGGQINVPPTGPCGKKRYMAPEVVMSLTSNQAYDGFKVDVWACGIVLFM